MTASELKTPCIAVCTIDGETGLCLGCARTLKEVASWSKLSGEQRDEIIDALPLRTEILREKGKLGPLS